MSDLADDIDVIDMVEALNMRNITVYVDEVNFSCPFPGHSHGDESPSMYMNIETTLFYCHGCKMKGNAVKFLAELEGVSYLTSMRWLRQRYSMSFREPAGDLWDELVATMKGKEEKEIKRNEILQDSALESFFYADDMWREAKANLDAGTLSTGIPFDAMRYALGRFEPDVLQEWGICISKHDGRLSIPIHDIEGNLIGFKGRAVDDSDVRYMALGDTPKTIERMGVRYGFTPYRKEQVVFGIDRVREGSGPLVVAEGEFDAIALQSVHGVRGVATGSDVSAMQAKMLLSVADEIILFFDTDKAGINGMHSAAMMLEPHANVRKVGSHDGDPASMSTDDVISLIDSAKTPILSIFEDELTT